VTPDPRDEAFHATWAHGFRIGHALFRGARGSPGSLQEEPRRHLVHPGLFPALLLLHAAARKALFASTDV